MFVCLYQEVHVGAQPNHFILHPTSISTHFLIFMYDEYKQKIKRIFSLSSVGERCILFPSNTNKKSADIAHTTS